MDTFTNTSLKEVDIGTRIQDYFYEISFRIEMESSEPTKTPRLYTLNVEYEVVQTR